MLTTVNLGQVRQLREGVLVAEGNVDETVVHEGGQCVGNGDLLSTTLGTSGNKHTTHLALKSTLAPKRASGVPESLYKYVNERIQPCRYKITYLPLNGEVTVTGGNTKEECVKVDKVIREENGIIGSRGCLDELQDIVGEGLLDPGAKSVWAHS